MQTYAKQIEIYLLAATLLKESEEYDNSFIE